MTFFDVFLTFFLSHFIYSTYAIDKCIPIYGTPGEYLCKFTSASEITNQMTCEVVGTHTCTSTKSHHVAGTPVETGIQYYTLRITLQKHVKSVHITIKDTTSTPPIFLDTFNLEYFHPFTERERIDCPTSVRDNFYTTKYTCNVWFSAENLGLSQQGQSPCTVQMNIDPNAVTPPPPPSSLLTKKTYTVAVTDSEAKCNQQCEVTLVTPDTDSSKVLISRIVKHKTTCPGPTIYCNNHDTEKRIMGCQMKVPYPFVQIKFSTSAPDDIVLQPTSVASATLSSNVITEVLIKYTVGKYTAQSKEFEISFKVDQSSQANVHEIKQKIKYILRKDELPYIECKPKSKSTNGKIGELTYECKIIANGQNPLLEIEGNEYTISPNNPTLSPHKDLFKIDRYEITISPVQVKCGTIKEVEIKLKNKNLQTKVQHSTTCPEPVINCNKHDTEQLSITCEITIYYDFYEIKLTSVQNHVTLTEPTTISKNGVTVGTAFRKIIQYTVDDFSKATNLDVVFEVIQTQGQSAVVKKTKNFKYKLKSNQTPGVSCTEKARTPDQKFESSVYSCKVISLNMPVALEMEVPKFVISSQTISNVQVANGIYTKENHEVAITAIENICNNHALINLFFEENRKKYSTTFPHVTNCPAPIIEYTNHNTISHQIHVKITIEYEFNNIEIISITQDVLITPITISYIPTQKIYEDISYAITDLQRGSEEFQIKLDVLQKESHLAYSSTQTFKYRLDQTEIPHIKCSLKGPKAFPNFAIVEYECDIVSKNERVQINKEPTENEYTISPQSAEGRKIKNLYYFRKFIIEITPTSIVCNKHKLVTIKIADGSESYKYSVSHTTICPTPVIDCSNHDVEARKITCGIKVQYTFNTISLTSSLGNKLTLNPASISYESQMGTSVVNKEITYELKNFLRNDHTFDIEFTVTQTGNNQAYSIKKTFSYILKPSEIPHLTCSKKDTQLSTVFGAVEYSCDVLSKSQVNTYNIEPKTYSIVPDPTQLTFSNEVYQNIALTVTVKPNSVVCSKVETIKILFIDGELTVSEMLKHETICPTPTFNYDGPNDQNRIISFKISVPYQFIRYSIESDTEKVSVSETSQKTPVIVNTLWEVNPSINYAPIDWSKDSHKFKIIVKLTLSSNQIIAAISKEFSVELIQSEKPKITCEKKEKSTSHFTLTYFSCTILSRLATVKVETDTNGYVILEQNGKSIEQNNVYKWVNYEILLRDDTIKCGESVGVNLVFKDNSPVTKTITLTTQCIDPVVNCETHDKVKRTIECNIVSQYPYHKVEFSVNQNQVEMVSSKSPDAFDTKVLKSKHLINYKVKKFKEVNRRFNLQYKIKQDDKDITTKAISIEYQLFEKEYPQVSCEPYLEETEKDRKITISTFMCYIVAEESPVSLSLDQTDYTMKNNMPVHTVFEDRFKWENVKVTVEDKKMHCNKTVNLTLSLKKDSSVVSHTILQHTTYCHELTANCILYQKDSNLVICNFSSPQSFTLHSFSCSEIVECRKASDLDKIYSNSQEYGIEFTPNTQGNTVEFQLNITLNYSAYSQMHYHFDLEYNLGGVIPPANQQRAASTGVISTTSVMILLAAVGTLLAFQILKKPKSVVEA